MKAGTDDPGLFSGCDGVVDGAGATLQRNVRGRFGEFQRGLVILPGQSGQVLDIHGREAGEALGLIDRLLQCGVAEVVREGFTAFLADPHTD